jgi:hypothetical protein
MGEAAGLAAHAAGGDRRARAATAEALSISMEDLARDPVDEVREPLVRGLTREISDPRGDGVPDVSVRVRGSPDEGARDARKGAEDAFFSHLGERNIGMGRAQAEFSA